MRPKARHEIDGGVTALKGLVRRIDRVQGRYASRGGQQRRLCQREFRGRLAQIQLSGSLGTEGAVAKVGRVEGPLEDLSASILTCGLSRQDALTQSTPNGGSLGVQQEIRHEALRESWVQCGFLPLLQGEAAVHPEAGIRQDYDGVAKGLREVLRVLRVER